MVRYTTVPPVYDGFGTRTLDPSVGSDRGMAVRRVEIRPDAFEWQSNRYASGCHPCLDERQWQNAVRVGFCSALPAATGAGPLVACPKCNGGQGWDKTRFTDESGCPLCCGSGEVSESDARDWIDSNRG